MREALDVMGEELRQQRIASQEAERAAGAAQQLLDKTRAERAGAQAELDTAKTQLREAAIAGYVNPKEDGQLAALLGDGPSQAAVQDVLARTVVRSTSDALDQLRAAEARLGRAEAAAVDAEAAAANRNAEAQGRLGELNGAYDQQAQLLESVAARLRRDSRPKPAGAAARELREADTSTLFSRYRQSGDRAVRNELIERHRWLAAAVAARYVTRGEPRSDLEQVGLIALLHAVERFDPNNGAPFNAYARATIQGQIQRHFRDRAWVMHVPRPLKDLHQRLARAVEMLSSELGRPPRPAEVAERLGVSVDDVLQAMQANGGYRAAASLDEPTHLRALSKHLACDDHAGRSTEHVFVAQLLAELSDRERRIIELRFAGGLTQREIARQVGLSQVQVGRIVSDVLDRLRRACDTVG